MSALRLQQVTKRYGQHVALAGLDLEVPTGATLALVGPNGAGKTTTMGIIAGLLRADGGRVELFGEPVDRALRRVRIGLMPQDAAPGPYLSIAATLTYYATLQGASSSRAREQAEHALMQVGLKPQAHTRFGELSHGMRRRFSVAQALLGDPDVILLDEPTSGLDPEVVVQIREVIAQHRGRATLVVSSHILSELETLCTHVAFLEAGRCIRQGTMTGVTLASSKTRYTLSKQPDLERLRQVLPTHRFDWDEPRLTAHAPEGYGVERTNAACLRELLDQAIGIQEVTAGDSLEASYLATRKKAHSPK
jgi:ABC-2 type transport system ATP-binding protein